MSGILGTLEKKIEEKMKQRIGILEPKLDEMNKHLENIEGILKKIEENTKK